MPPRLPYLVYADPPWTQALLTGFYTKAGLPKPAYDWLDVYRRVVALAGDGQWPCFMEGGARQGREVARVCRGEVYESWLATYYHSRKNRGLLHYCGPGLPRGAGRPARARLRRLAGPGDGGLPWPGCRAGPVCRSGRHRSGRREAGMGQRLSCGCTRTG